MKRLGDSLWLYLWLVAQANCRGYVCKEFNRIVSGLSQPEDVVKRWLQRLNAAGLIAIEHPPPYLVIRLCFWSGETPEPVPQAPEIGPTAADPGEARAIYVPVRQQQAAAADVNNRDRGPGEGDLSRICRDLQVGSGDIPDVEDLLGCHPPAVVDRALSRVLATPQSQIRKSRLALFRYLLVKLS